MVHVEAGHAPAHHRHEVERRWCRRLLVAVLFSAVLFSGGLLHARDARVLRHRLAEALPRPLIERAVYHHGVRHARRDGRGSELHRGRGTAATSTRASGVVQLRNAERADERELVVAVGGERDHPVDVVRREAGLRDRREDRLARELELGAPGVLGEFRLTDADDRGLVGVVRLHVSCLQRQ